jgi:hypothetical protein
LTIKVFKKVNDSGYIFDTGIHYLGKETQNLLDFWITNKKIEWSFTKIFDRFIFCTPQGESYTQQSKSFEFKSYLKVNFPENIAEIDKLFKLVGRCKLY